MIYSIWGPTIKESSFDSNLQTLRHETLFLCLYVLLNNSVCVLSALTLNSNGLLVCVRQGTKELHFRLYLNIGVIMIMLPLLSVPEKITKFLLDISILSTFCLPLQWCKRPDSKYLKILFCLHFSLLQVASLFYR